jgi:hypothetical protein
LLEDLALVCVKVKAVDIGGGREFNRIAGPPCALLVDGPGLPQQGIVSQLV